MVKIILAAMLVASVALAQDDAPRRVIMPVHDGVFRTPDNLEVIVEVTGGAYLDDAALMGVASEMEQLRAENKVLREAPVATPTVVIVAALLGVVLGGGAVLYLRR